MHECIRDILEANIVQVGGVILILVLNCIIIFVLYRLQQESLEKRIKNLKNQIQDLEDLVAAIIEEFEEVAAITDAKTTEIKDAILESSNMIESDEQIPKNLTADYDNPIPKNNINASTPNNPSQRIDPAISDHSAPTGESEPGVGVETAQNVKFSRPVSDPKHQHILELWEQGVSIEEIAKTLGTGRGEIQLILGIYRRS